RCWRSARSARTPSRISSSTLTRSILPARLLDAWEGACSLRGRTPGRTTALPRVHGTVVSVTTLRGTLHTGRSFESDPRGGGRASALSSCDDARRALDDDAPSSPRDPPVAET